MAPPDRSPRLEPGVTWSNLKRAGKILFTVVTGIGSVLGVYLTFAGAVHAWPFGELPDVRVDVASSRVEAPGPSDEYICVVNKDGGDVNLLGWVLRDAEGDVNTLPDVTLDSEQRIRVHPGDGTDSETDLYGREGTAQWNDQGDTITLFDDEGNEIDSETYERGSGMAGIGCGPR